MTLPELSACPFCGGEARLTNGGTGNYYVRCTACAANTDDGSRERAIAAWNTRTGQLVERDAVAGVLDEACHVIASHYPRTGPTGIRSIDSRSTAFREFEPPAVLAKIEAALAAIKGAKMLTDEMKAAGLTEAELHILQHSLGVDQYGQGEQYRNTDIRKAELDPSTFAHPEEFQREPYNPWGMRLLLVWCVGAVILGGWAVVKLIEWVL